MRQGTTACRACRIPAHRPRRDHDWPRSAASLLGGPDGNWRLVAAADAGNPIRPGSDNLPPLPQRRRTGGLTHRSVRRPSERGPRRGPATFGFWYSPRGINPARRRWRHLLDEQREAEPNALAKNPRAGHLELGHRQVELLELTRRDPQLQCPIQRFNVRFPDRETTAQSTSSPHAPGAPARLDMVLPAHGYASLYSGGRDGSATASTRGLPNTWASAWATTSSMSSGATPSTRARRRRAALMSASRIRGMCAARAVRP